MHSPPDVPSVGQWLQVSQSWSCCATRRRRGCPWWANTQCAHNGLAVHPL